MPFDNIFRAPTRTSLIPERGRVRGHRARHAGSVALTLCRSVTMSAKTKTMPVLSALPVAYWVNGDTGLKQTTEAAWAGIELVAEELATIIPVPEAVLDDADFDVWNELEAPIAEAVALKLDQAVFAGIDKPASWPAAIIPAAQAAGNVELDRQHARTGRRRSATSSRRWGSSRLTGSTRQRIAARSDFKRLIRSARSARATCSARARRRACGTCRSST